MARVSLQHLSLEVNDREFLVIAGPPGCGNSGALRMIAGLDPISKGDIFIGDKRVNALPPGDRDIGMVFRNFSVLPHMTVFENMAVGLKFRKFPQPEIKKRVTEAAAILGLEKQLDRKPGALSGEDRQRVAVGRAIVRQPKVFLFDDPLANLDVRMRLAMRTELIRLHQRLQATMIYATHDQAEAMSMAGRVAVMSEGVIQQTDSPRALYRDPANLFVAGFLGSPPMNFIHGKLRESGGALIFKEAPEGVIELKLGERPEAGSYAGRDIIAGVRPEDIVLVTGTEPAKAPRFRSLLDIAENLGPETLVHLQTGAHTLACRTQAAIGSDEAGHRAQFEIDPSRVHLFDPATTRRITA